MFRRAAPKSTATNASITDAAPCQKSLKLRVGHEALAPIRAAVLAEFQKEAVLPGFRKGKAPADLVERQYAKAIREETVNRAAKQALEHAAKEHELKPVSPFEIRSAQFSDADGLSLEAVVEVEPSFALGEYKGIALPQASEAVSPEELQRALTQLQESMAQLEPVPGKEGEAKQRRVPPLDDELAKDMGFAGLQALTDHVEAKLREQKRVARLRAQETAIGDELLKRHAFEVPPGLVSHQTERLARDFKVRLLLSGMPEAQVSEEAAKFTEQLRDSAARHVKLTFILDRIAARESVAIEQNELVERLWQLSQRWKKDPAEVRKLFDDQGLWPSVLSAIRQEKTMALLLSTAVTHNGGSA